MTPLNSGLRVYLNCVELLPITALSMETRMDPLAGAELALLSGSVTHVILSAMTSAGLKSENVDN